MSKANLSREITVFSLVAYYFSTVVGVGAFIIPMQAAQIAGPASLISWALMLLLTYPIAMIYAHISQRYKVSGSVQKFLEDAGGVKFGKSMALYLVISAMFGNMLLAYYAGEYLMNLLDIDNSELLPILACIFLAVSCLFNLIQVGVSSKIQSISLVLICSVILAIVISAVPYYDTDNLEPFMPNGTGSIISAIIICSYAVVGWENVDAMAEEVKDPDKTYRKAIKIALLIIAVFYVFLAATVVLVLSPEQINEGNPLIPSLLRVTANFQLTQMATLLVLILLMLGCNSWIFGTSRILFSLGRDRALPEFLSYVNPKNQIPVMAILIQLLVYATIAVMMMVSEAERGAILTITAFNYLILYTIVFFCGAKNFTTAKLRGLATVSFLTCIFLLLADANGLMAISFVTCTMCFFYIYVFKRRHFII